MGTLNSANTTTASSSGTTPTMSSSYRMGIYYRIIGHAPNSMHLRPNAGGWGRVPPDPDNTVADLKTS